MGKLIIVEGIDRVGKTTLCNKLSTELNIPIFKDNCTYEGYNDKRVNYEKMNTIVNMLEQLEVQDFISDRLHLTEMVYGAFDREYDSSDLIKSIDKRLSKLDVLLILVKPTSIEKSSKEHGGDLRRHERLFKILYDCSTLDKMSCTYDTLHVAVANVKSWMEKSKGV